MKKHSNLRWFFLIWFVLTLCFYLVALTIFPVNEENTLQVSDSYMSAMIIAPFICALISVSVKIEKEGNVKHIKPTKAPLIVICIVLFIAGIGVLSSASGPAFPSIILLLVISSLFVFLIISSNANNYMQKHRMDVVLANDLMNNSVALDDYFEHRNEVISYLSKMAKTEIFLKKKNGLTERPSKLLRQIQENENLHVHTAILRMANNCKKFAREEGLPFSGMFKKQIEMYSNRLSPENLKAAQECLLDLQEYETVVGKIQEADRMNGHEFEHWCANLLKKNGFSDVEVTKGSGDQGVDVLATKEGIRYAIQCKCYSSDLGNSPIQEVHAGKSMYHCQVGAVMTNRHFTSGAKELAEATGVLLWGREKLQEMLKAANA